MREPQQDVTQTAQEEIQYPIGKPFTITVDISKTSNSNDFHYLSDLSDDEESESTIEFEYSNPGSPCTPSEEDKLSVLKNKLIETLKQHIDINDKRKFINKVYNTLFSHHKSSLEDAKFVYTLIHAINEAKDMDELKTIFNKPNNNTVKLSDGLNKVVTQAHDYIENNMPVRIMGMGR